ncbi:hypothetical protein K443DRAFT_82608, partial [Laccaria amethystina LaAM-08-1]
IGAPLPCARPEVEFYPEAYVSADGLYFPFPSQKYRWVHQRLQSHGVSTIVRARSKWLVKLSRDKDAPEATRAFTYTLVASMD